MNNIDSEKIAWDTHYDLYGSGARPPIGELDKSATLAVSASLQKPQSNGSPIDGVGFATPPTQMRPLSQQKERPKQIVPNDAPKVALYELVAKDDVDMNHQMEPTATPVSPSEDELLEGEVGWTEALSHPKLLATGLCYDIRMRYHSELDPPKQRLDFHPEDPRRIYHIYRALCQAGLYKDPQFNVPTIEKPLERIQARNATASEICLVHTANHYHFVASTAGNMSSRECKHRSR